MKEIWKDIPGYEGIYKISNYGRIKSIHKKWNILKLHKGKDGYLRIVLWNKGRPRNHLISRLVLTVFDRPPKSKEQCNHKNGICVDNKIKNLEWCTGQENIQHRINKLKIYVDNRGEKQGRHKITENDVREIRVLLKEGRLTQKQIAQRYGLCHTSISAIKLRQSWRHVK